MCYRKVVFCTVYIHSYFWYSMKFNWDIHIGLTFEMLVKMVQSSIYIKVKEAFLIVMLFGYLLACV